MHMLHNMYFISNFGLVEESVNFIVDFIIYNLE